MNASQCLRIEREGKLSSLQMGIFRLEGKEFSVEEDEIEQGREAAILKPEGPQSEAVYSLGPLLNTHVLTSCHAGYRPCPESPGRSGVPLPSPRLPSSCKDTISRDMKPKGL